MFASLARHEEQNTLFFFLFLQKMVPVLLESSSSYWGRAPKPNFSLSCGLFQNYHHCFENFSRSHGS